MRLHILNLHLTLREKHIQSFTSKYEVSCGFQDMPIIRLRIFPSIFCLLTLLLFFNHEWTLDFAKCFFHVNWSAREVLLLQVANMVDNIDFFFNMEPFFHPCDEPQLVLMYIFLYNAKFSYNFLNNGCIWIYENIGL